MKLFVNGSLTRNDERLVRADGVDVAHIEIASGKNSADAPLESRCVVVRSKLLFW